MDLGNLTGYLQLEASGWDKALEGAMGKLEDFAGKGVVKAAAAGIGIAGALGAAALGAMDMEKANSKLSAQLGLTGPESGRIGKLAGELYASNYGDSLEGVNDGVAAVMSSINGMRTASSGDLKTVTADALNFASAMGVDVSEAATTAGALVNTGLAKNAQGAFDLMTAGAQKVGPAMVGPLMDATNEYSKHFQMIGMSGQQAMSVLATASSGGEIAIDKAGDAVKEFGIRATDLSDTNASQAFQDLGLNAKTMADDILAGGDKASGATAQVATALLKIKDPAKQALEVTRLFGTQAEDIGKQNMPAFLQGLAGAPGALGNVEGAAQRMGDTLNNNASSNLETFRRSAQQAFVSVLGGQVLPLVDTVAKALAGGFGPALDGLTGILTGTVLPALKSLGQFIADNQTPVTIVGALIAAVFIPHLIAMGVQATINGAKVVASWVAQQAATVAAAAVHSAEIAKMVAGWVLAGAQAAINAVKVVAGWVAMSAGAVASGAATAAAWVAAQVRTLASLAVMAAGFIAQGAVMVASAAVTAAGVVAGWVLMGAQAMLQAARMAAAWFIALGPVGWVIAAVIGLVALIVANWDTVKKWTTEAWAAVTAAVGAAWEWIKGAVSAALDFVVNLFLNFTGPGLIIKHWDAIRQATVDAWNAVVGAVSAAIDAVVGFVTGLIGKIGAALAGMGAALAGIATAAWQWFYDNVVAKVGEFLSFVGGLSTKAVTALASLGSSIADVATTAWQWFYNNVVTKIGEFLLVVGGLPAKAVAGLANLGSQLAGVATTAWQWFYDHVVTKVGEVLSYVGGIPGKILSSLGDMGRTLLSAGEDLINGLIQGIKNMAGKIADAVLGPIKSAVSGVKSFLGINSPSRLFAEIGGNMGAGLVVGMDKAAPDVAASMSALASTQALGALAGLGTPTLPAGALTAGAATGGDAGARYVDRSTTTVYATVDAASLARELEATRRDREFLATGGLH